MKQNALIISILLLLLLPFGLSAQVQPEMLKKKMLQNLSFEQTQTPPLTMDGSSVFIEQVGNYNMVSSVVMSQTSDLNYQQYGNANVIVVGADVKSAEANILQTGDRNFSFDFANDPTAEIQLDLVQKGSGHHFERHGTNSIGARMKFRMEGDSQALIIRNFK